MMAEEEFKSWWDLTEAEQRRFARKVLEEDIHGWDELKEAAEEFGFEPTEDMPTVYELQDRAKTTPRLTESTGTTNRIKAAIERINKKLATVSAAEKEKLSQGLKTSLPELIEYQKLQSTAFACGKLTFEEADTLYKIYGGEVPTPEKWNKLSLAEKVVGTSAAAELAKSSVCNIL